MLPTHQRVVALAEQRGFGLLCMGRVQEPNDVEEAQYILQLVYPILKLEIRIGPDLSKREQRRGAHTSATR